MREGEGGGGRWGRRGSERRGDEGGGGRERGGERKREEGMGERERERERKREEGMREGEGERGGNKLLTFNFRFVVGLHQDRAVLSWR